MLTPETLDKDHTLRTAVERFEALRTQESLAGGADDPEADSERLPRSQILELLALAEVIARKVGYGRQLTVRAAREAGASWTEIGTALSTTQEAAWEAHNQWIQEQATQYEATRISGLDELQIARAKRRAGRPENPQV